MKNPEIAGENTAQSVYLGTGSPRAQQVDATAAVRYCCINHQRISTCRPEKGRFEGSRSSDCNIRKPWLVGCNARCPRQGGLRVSDSHPGGAHSACAEGSRRCRSGANGDGKNSVVCDPDPRKNPA